jgi:ComF family protein
MTYLINTLRSYLHAFIHLLYPHICLQCGVDEILETQIICDACESQLPFTHFEQMQINPIEKIFWGRAAITNATALLFFTKESIVQKIIIALKYQQNKKAGYLLGRLISNELVNNYKYNEIDYLIPIPISKRKIKKRGFNQSELICEAIVANGYKVPIFKGLLKNKEVITQTQKDRLQRAQENNTLFSLKHHASLTGKHLLIIDDVITTGATLEAAIHTLLMANPASIHIAAAAYTYHS